MTDPTPRPSTAMLPVAPSGAWPPDAHPEVAIRAAHAPASAIAACRVSG
jgi:hypothetical protein